MRHITLLLFIFALTIHAAIPDTPTGLEASDAAFPNKIALSWEHVRDAQIYRVYRSSTNDPTSAHSIGVTESITFADVTGPGETYFYWVRAEGDSGVSGLGLADQGSTNTGLAPFVPPPGSGIPVPTPQVLGPTANPVTGAKAYLGKTLFWDEQLSATRTVACGTCHIFRAGGADARSAAPGVPGSMNPGLDGIFGTADDTAGSRGSPLTRSDGSYEWSTQFGVKEQVTSRRASSVLDAAFASIGVLWDGRPGFKFNDPITNAPIFTVNAALEAQALLPLLDPVEMGSDGRTITDVAQRVQQSSPLALASTIPTALAKWISGRTYADLFTEAFGASDITPAKIAMAIASYERTLIADRTPVDGSAFTQTLIAGLNAFGAGRCGACHQTPLTSDELFQVTGVRPPAEDLGRALITGSPQDQGSFRVPSLRNAGLRRGLFHTGRTSLEDVVEFYNRGGDFKTSPGFVNGLIAPLNFTTQQRADLVKFLHYQLTDQRVAAEAGPIFDRPVLYSESARVPVIVGQGSGTVIPEAVAIEPPFTGNPQFTVAVSNVSPGATAILIIDAADPGVVSAIPTTASFARQQVTTSSDGAGHGFASITLAIPNDPTLAGKTLYGRWYIGTGPTLAISPAFRFTIFAPSPDADTFISLNSASLMKGTVAPGSLVSGFGSVNLLPPSPFPLVVSITDRAGTSFEAKTTFNGASQINYLVPAGAAEGEAIVRIQKGAAQIASGKLQIAAVAPGIFSANSDGRDVAAALVQRNSAAPAGIIQFDSGLGRQVPLPINLGAASDQTVLLLFGTGIRARDATTTTATIAGAPVQVLYAGAQGQFDGLDQINILIPQSLAGKGETDLSVTVDGHRANTVRVAIQ